MAEIKVGVIGGSGLYQIEGMADVEEVEVKTPFGKPSDPVVLGTLEGIRVAFLPRHGRGHRISPSELPVKANIYALKSLGVERIISVNAAGSLREEFRPLDIVIPEQLIDYTKGRDSTFFAGGLVAHVSMAEPFCASLRQTLETAARETGVTVYKRGTYLTVEGPQLSSKAESHLYRSWGADIIGMTAATEAKLAREAEICYAVLANITDYDCWYEGYASVTVEMILDYLKRNVATIKGILKLALPRISSERTCPCGTALKDALATSPQHIPAATKARLDLLVGKYLK
ncbi:MAG: S-methyl-5'-thioadenosine phosphorylase [Chloroflexota bacterium]